MRVVYIAGKFRAPTAWEMAENVREAERWPLKVADCGAMYICTHLNSQHFHGMLTDQFWLDGTLELLKRCDAALFIPNWMDSTGARAEHAFAKQNGIEIFGAGHVPVMLKHWVLTGER